MNTILARLQEPSTYLGIAAFAGVLGFGFADQIPVAGEYIAKIVVAAAGLVAMFTKDPGSAE